jgi:tRNA A-37 threonylcarbamoyl transferase component Bud32
VVIPPDREDLICHDDLAPWNLVRDGDRWVFIDGTAQAPAHDCEIWRTPASTFLHSASLTGEQPWARLYAEGHGEHWGPVADYIEAHLERWTSAILD